MIRRTSTASFGERLSGGFSLSQRDIQVNMESADPKGKGTTWQVYSASWLNQTTH